MRRKGNLVEFGSGGAASPLLFPHLVLYLPSFERTYFFRHPREGGHDGEVGSKDG